MTRIEPRSGIGLQLTAGQLLQVTDPCGEQVADLFACARGDPSEWLSSGRSIDYNGTLALTCGHVLYSNRSRPLFTIVEDDVGRHDFLFAPCSKEMFRIQYGHAPEHATCQENLERALGELGVTAPVITTPFNLFMNSSVRADGRVEIGPPRSQAGDRVVLRAESDLCVAVSACAALTCNNGTCTPIDVEVLK